MLKKHKRTLILTSLLILLPVLAGLLLWNTLPERIATHWGPDGQPDGWSGKSSTVFFLPFLILAMHWFCILITSADKRNEKQTGKVFTMVAWICPIVSNFAGFAVFGTALGMDFDMNRLIFLLTGIIFMVIGNYLPKCKYNYTIGIKLPWTLNSEKNWNATHRFSGKVMVIGSIILILCAFIPSIESVWVILAILGVLVLISTLYSYFYSRKETE